MSRKWAYALLVVTMACTTGTKVACPEAGIEGLATVIENQLVTTLSFDPETIHVGEIVKVTANIVDENPDTPFYASRYRWTGDGALYESTVENYRLMTFDKAGTVYVDVVIEGTRAGIDLAETAGAYVTVLEQTEDVDDSPDPVAPTVTISGPDDVMVGTTGSYSASVSSGSATYTWDLLGTEGSDGSVATLGSTSGDSTTVTGVDIGYVTLVVEARDPILGNVLATSSMTIDIGSDYVVWYTGNVDCWGAPRIYVSTRASFDSWQSTASIPGGGTDSSEELEKVEIQGGFESSTAANEWICPQFTSKASSYWCGYHYNMGGSYYMSGNLSCDLSSLPTEE